MYNPVPAQKTCVRAWLAATSLLFKAGNEAYNVVIDVDEPIAHDESEHRAITVVDTFLRKHDLNPVVTVANTIFPQSLYDDYGVPEFYRAYHEDFDKLGPTKRWGRYFERITRHKTLSGKTYNPLETLVDKMRGQEEAGVRYKSAYELAVYDPLLDGRVLYGGQCLSFLSFKLNPQKGLMLTAVYRNHTYITRLLGNLIGLGRLQSFVAQQAGLKLGPLTVVSTHAEVDTGPGWGQGQVGTLLDDVRQALAVAPMSIA